MSPQLSRAFSCNDSRDEFNRQPELKACLEQQVRDELRQETDDELNIPGVSVSCEELMEANGDIDPESVRRFKQCKRERLVRQIYDGHIRPIEASPRFP